MLNLFFRKIINAMSLVLLRTAKDACAWSSPGVSLSLTRVKWSRICIGRSSVVSRVERLVGVRSASGSATLTRLLELAAARSGTGDLERSRLASGSPNTSFSKIEVTGHHPHVKVPHELMSTYCLLRVQYCPRGYSCRIFKLLLASDNSFRNDAMSM